MFGYIPVNIRQRVYTRDFSLQKLIASGKRLHNYGKIHHAINGKTHYFDWAIFNSYVGLPEGTLGCQITCVFCSGTSPSYSSTISPSELNVPAELKQISQRPAMELMTQMRVFPFIFHYNYIIFRSFTI